MNINVNRIKYHNIFTKTHQLNVTWGIDFHQSEWDERKENWRKGVERKKESNKKYIKKVKIRNKKKVCDQQRGRKT